MMFAAVALIAPLAVQEAMYAPRPERKRQSAFVTLWKDDVRTVTYVPRTVASPDQWHQPAAASTSASYPQQTVGVAVVVAPGTSAIPAQVGTDDRVPFMLNSVKRMTGWSWERVAESLGRSRQAVHGWTLGKDISEPNREHLSRLHATLSYIDRGSVEENRGLLQSSTKDGRLVADLLKEGEFDEVRTLLGQGNGNRELASRLQFAASVQQNEAKPHWFERLAEAPVDEQPLEIIPAPGERKRAVVRRRG